MNVAYWLLTELHILPSEWALVSENEKALIYAFFDEYARAVRNAKKGK